MDDERKAFNKRISKIMKKHGSTKNYKSFSTQAKIQGDVPIYQTKKYKKPRLKLRNIVIFAIWGYLFILGLRIFLSIKMGVDIYDQRIEELKQGNQGERIGAYAMYRDPPTRYVGNTLQLLINEFITNDVDATLPDSSESNSIDAINSTVDKPQKQTDTPQ